MHWESPSQINTYFGLNAPSDDPSDVRRAVVNRMAHIHPDRTGLSFPSSQVENEWHGLKSAKEFIDAMSGDSQLVQLSQVLSLVKSVNQEALVPIASRISLLKQEARSEAKHRSLFPRIGSGTIAAICSFLFTFPSAVKDHPLLSKWVNTQFGQITLLGMTIYAVIIFLMTWFGERRFEEKIDFLSSEGAGRILISRMLSKYGNGDSRRFVRRDLVRSIEYTRASTYPWGFLFGGGRLTPTMVDGIVELQLNRLTARGVVVELPQKGFDRIFEISKAAVEELKNLFDD